MITGRMHTLLRRRYRGQPAVIADAAAATADGVQDEAPRRNSILISLQMRLVVD